MEIVNKAQAEPRAIVGPPPENLALDPSPSPGSDPSIDFDWEPAPVGTCRSVRFIVTSAEDHPLLVTIEQGAYQRSIQGEGLVRGPVIPAAPYGTTGKLTARDTQTGATAALMWQWHPQNANKKPPPAAKAKGFLARLLSNNRKAVAAPLSVEQRLGPRAAFATTLSFFGREAVGQRFAFILDMSGSMRGERWTACTHELERTLSAMPEYAEFFVILFSGQAEPPGQYGWMSAERVRVGSVIEWLKEIRPAGGTYPANAFERVFSLPEPADIVYFLTDGELAEFGPAECAAIRGSNPTIINTIALGNEASAGILEAMAADSGGSFTHVPVQGSR